MEKLILKPHHVEVQVFGDGKGKAIHLGERECSIQRRHQKVWEETPSPLMNRFPETREKMFAAAIKIAENVNYAGAGTLEFIADENGNFYFLEMNTRLQVEHPVSEWVTGVDLVAWQLFLAAGEFKLPAVPERRGSAIEVRLYAEDPKTFLPAPGPLGYIELPTGAFVRTDSAFSGPGEVSMHYDPMISKISVWAESRPAALDRLRSALDEVRVEPPRKLSGLPHGSLRTNLTFLRRLVRNSSVLEGDTPTDLIQMNPALTAPAIEDPSCEAAIATALVQLLYESGAMTDLMTGTADTGKSQKSAWALAGRREGNRL
ncbi:MAG: hypothetical protein A2Z97_14950 [Bdellovibrionales bacterium GWB1_52_6]|nr:MAG: hypothetical protein A2Z97_14950 [Bdellovibrionales bacterium GWB1_52_6]